MEEKCIYANEKQKEIREIAIVWLLAAKYGSEESKKGGGIEENEELSAKKWRRTKNQWRMSVA